MNDDDGEDREYRKPMHDGRAPYYKVLEKMHMALEAARMTGDLELWFRTMDAVYDKVSPFCKNDEVVAIPEKMKEARNLMQAQRNLRGSRMLRHHNVAVQYAQNEAALEETLGKIHGMIHFATREMMLPLKADNDDDLDMDKALRGSGA